MTLPSLAVDVLLAGYSYEDGELVRAVKLDGGRSRMRQDYLNASMTCTVSFMLTKMGYQYLQSFFKTTIKNGSLPFNAQLVTDDGDLRSHECRFVPNSLKMRPLSNNVFSCNAVFEVNPIARDAEFDATVVWLYEIYGDSSYDLFLSVEHLTNVIMPETIGA